MLDFQEIKAQYPEQLHGFDRAILREYLQYKILQAIFDSIHASDLSFLGGTALRIVHGNSRFSEDIDLDNFGLDWNAFVDLIEIVKRFMKMEGFEVETINVERGAFRCYLRFPGLLFGTGLSSHREEKILIQVDTVDQRYEYQPEMKILNKFDIFTEVRVTPLDLLLSQKIFTAVNRKRAKGRDFFDITFLFGRTKPDYGFIKQKMGIDSPEELRGMLLEKIKGLDFPLLAEDVAPFLIDKDQAKRVIKFREFWEQAEMV
jgi:predicted nucleotidyltransferase component of viral defense system